VSGTRVTIGILDKVCLGPAGGEIKAPNYQSRKLKTYGWRRCGSRRLLPEARVPVQVRTAEALGNVGQKGGKSSYASLLSALLVCILRVSGGVGAFTKKQGR